MGEKDIKSNELLADTENFADIVNFVVYDGKQVVKPEDLEERDTSEILSVYGISGKTDAQHKIRDILKVCVIKKTSNVTFVLMGIENQTKIHYAMPVRNMTYDALNYGAQINEARKKHVKDKDTKNSAEFLSGFTKEDETLLSFVEDYHIHLLVPKEIVDFSKFKTFVGSIFEVIKASSDEKEMDKLLTDNAKYKHLNNEAVSAINLFAGLDISVNEKKGVTDMCKAWDDHRSGGKVEGKAEGKAEDLLLVLGLKGDIPESVQSTIMAQHDTTILTDWLLKACTVNSVAEFTEMIF